MPEHQINLPLETGHSAPPAAVPELRDEIARAWGLPLGEQVELGLRDGSLDALTGLLELASTPDYPWNPRQPLQLRIAGFVFSSRDIEHWAKI